MATEPESAGERSTSTCPGQREQHHRRGTPIGRLSLCYPGGQQQPASFRRGSPSSPPRPNHADPRLRWPVLATPFTVLSTIQFLQTTPHHVERGGNLQCTYEILSNFVTVAAWYARHSYDRQTTRLNSSICLLSLPWQFLDPLTECTHAHTHTHTHTCVFRVFSKSWWNFVCKEITGQIEVKSIIMCRPFII